MSAAGGEGPAGPGRPFADWRPLLRGEGFTFSSTGGRRGLYAVRERPPFQQAVGVMLHRHREGEFTVALHVSMPLPGAEPPHHVILLDGDLGPSGVRVVDGGGCTWWPLQDREEALAALEADGLPWLDRAADLDALAVRFEEEVARGEAAAEEARGTLRARLGRALGIDALRPPRPRHNVHRLHLALVEEARGRPDAALEWLDGYEAGFDMGASPAQLARLARHREALGGSR